MKPDISEHQVPLAAEDKFLIISIREAQTLCPGIEDASALGLAIELSKPFLGDLIPLLDLRGLPQIYNDVETFIGELGLPDAQILLNPATAKQLDLTNLRQACGCNVLIARGQTFRASAFDLSQFRAVGDASRSPLEGLADYLNLVLGRRRKDSVGAIEERAKSKYILNLINDCFGKKSCCGVTARAFARSLPEFAPAFHRSYTAHGNSWSSFRSSLDAYSITQSVLLHAFLRKLYRNSLLVEFVMTSAGDEITCVPYHAGAINSVEFPGKSDVLVARPGVIADRTNAIFSDEVRILGNLINSKSTREHDLQKFLEAHPAFLKGLNYSNIYPQVVLQRDDGTSLRPDFILEPYDDAWCDILDIKLPGQSVIVGRNDRATLAAGIHEVAAQLREYAAYFEQDRYRKWVREKYGLRVYRPRLIAVVGRDMKRMAEEEVRRAMTAYEDLQIMTFDQLVTHAKSRLLI